MNIKKLLHYLGLSTLLILITYVSVAFTTLTWNPLEWPSGTRLGMTIIFFLTFITITVLYIMDADDFST